MAGDKVPSGLAMWAGKAKGKNPKDMPPKGVGKEPATKGSTEKKDSSSSSSDSSEEPAGHHGVIDGDFGGQGKFTLPADHVAAGPVPDGGASCSTCRFLEPNGTCNNDGYQRWNGGSGKLLVENPENFCSDWWEPAKPV